MRNAVPIPPDEFCSFISTVKSFANSKNHFCKPANNQFKANVWGNARHTKTSLQNKIRKDVRQAVRKWNIIANIKKRIEKLIRLYAELAGGLRWKKQTYNSPSIDDSNTKKCREKKKTVDKLSTATSLPSFIQEPDLN